MGSPRSVSAAATRWRSLSPADALAQPIWPPRRTLLGTLGRVLLFVLVFGAMSVVCHFVLGPPVRWLFALIGLDFRVDDVLGLVSVVVATTLMLRAVDLRSWQDLGLGKRSAAPTTVARGFFIGAAAITGACALLYVLGWLRVVPSVPGSSLAAALRVSGVLFVAALTEELLCRGYLLSAIRDTLGMRGAVVATSVLFGLLHTFNPGATLESVLLVTLAGVFLAMIRVVFDSLYAAWAAHAAWNWVMAVPLHAKVSGMQLESPDYRAVSTGPEWISGGAWGPEGGAAAALGMLAAIAYLYTRRGREET